jgi:predicted DCC family thiol-disulfide oxidoreductase YuxK
MSHMLTLGKKKEVIILFDGVCNLCNSFVDFILRADKRGVFKLGALQSDSGRKLLSDYHVNSPDLGSVILLLPDGWHKESRAVLEIFKRLPFPWSLFYAGIILPPFLRDGLYQQVALRRYRMFGKRDTCRIPSPQEASRFV